MSKLTNEAVSASVGSGHACEDAESAPDPPSCSSTCGSASTFWIFAGRLDSFAVCELCEMVESGGHDAYHIRFLLGNHCAILVKDVFECTSDLDGNSF